jgi:hypothetical protein
MSRAHGLSLPHGLIDLIDRGVWPTTENDKLQNLEPIGPKDYLKSINEFGLYLYPPPFRTVRQHEANRSWRTPGSMDGVDGSLLVVLGDFGAGSDAFIVLDYRTDPPSVLGEQWFTSDDGTDRTRWRQLAASFDDWSRLVFPNAVQ